MTVAIPNAIQIVTETSSFQVEESGVYTFAIQQPEVELEVRGVFEAVKKELIDVTVIIHHQAPHTRANTILKGVARDKSKLRFVGRIIIDSGCPDTNSFLTERVLLLSDTAQAETVPDLEIESDDVKCSHAASISRIPEEHLFYLMSRGLVREQAEQLIIEGFLQTEE